MVDRIEKESNSFRQGMISTKTKSNSIEVALFSGAPNCLWVLKSAGHATGGRRAERIGRRRGGVRLYRTPRGGDSIKIRSNPMFLRRSGSSMPLSLSLSRGGPLPLYRAAPFLSSFSLALGSRRKRGKKKKEERKKKKRKKKGIEWKK